jgi:hypothetical protein
LSRIVSGDQLNGPGADVAWLAPLPWFAELHLAYQVTSPALPDGTTAGDRRTLVERLVQYFQLGDATSVGVGLSAAQAHLPGAGAWDDLAAADLYVKVRPLQSRGHLALQGEVFARHLQGTPADGNQVGGYAQAVWRAGPFWAFGLRYDNAPAAASAVEQRYTALISFLPSEFSHLRLQGGLDQLPGERVGYQGVLALEFAIGAHGAHPF